MRILQVNTEKTWRGGERQTLYTLEGLMEQSIEVCLLTIKGSLMHQKAKELGVSVITAKDSFQVFKKLSSLKGRFDCIHAQTGKAHTQCILTKAFHRAPVVYTRRVDFVPSGLFTRLKYRLTNKVVSISPAISEILVKSNMCSQSPIVSSAVKRKILNVERAKKIRSDLGIADHKKIVGLVSALEAHKDPMTAFRVAQRLHSLRDDFVVLHFGDGAMFSQVSSMVEKSNISSVYFLAGYRNNVEDCFSIMDVFLMTSAEEGLGSSVLDAFCYEVGVVSTNAGGLKDLVQDRGFLCEVGDINCLAKGLSNALNMNSETIAYKAKAKMYCDNEMGIDVMVSKYLSLYQEVMNG